MLTGVSHAHGLVVSMQLAADPVSGGCICCSCLGLAMVFCLPNAALPQASPAPEKAVPDTTWRDAMLKYLQAKWFSWMFRSLKVCKKILGA